MLRAISGSNTSACLPKLNALQIASVYTSVLPEPGTPSNSETSNFFFSTAVDKACDIMACSSDKVGPGDVQSGTLKGEGKIISSRVNFPN